MKLAKKTKDGGVSLVEFVIRAFAKTLGNVSETALNWKIERVTNKVGR